MLDRRKEREAIDRVLDAVRDGFSGTLVLYGGPGVGKTTLLRYAADAAKDLRVTSVTGIESEISMGFGGLHHLLMPFLPLVDGLPVPQRAALRVAFGRDAGPAPERFLVGLAALTLLSRAAEEQPVLCLIDDAHWLDRESAQVLGFVSRRLHADRVGLIAATNAPAEQGYPTIEVEGLPDDAARELLASISGGSLSVQSVDRILSETRNNPLALTELGSEYPAAEISGRAALPAPLPLGQRLRERFLLDVVTTPDALEVPSHITGAEARGFALSVGKMVLGGGVGQVAELARANLRDIPH